MALSSKKNSMQITFCPTCGDITPIFSFFNVPKVGEEVNHRTLKLTRVYSIIGLNEWISKVINGVSHEWIKLLMVVHEIVRVSKVDGGA
jgi:hypothetical protein